MSAEFSDLWEFGEFRIDVSRKVLWRGEEPVAMPLKEIELLSMLVRNRGEMVTKDELLDEIWSDSFVDESNLTRHIYLLRKTLKDLGADEMIENVPRRGYRFAGDLRQVVADEIVLEKHTRTRTSIKVHEARDPKRWLVAAATAIAVVAIASFVGYRFMQVEAKAPPIRSLAVVPFKTIGSDQGSSHAGAGLADILTTRLSRINDLKVKSASVAGITDLPGAGERLQVDAILEGTIYGVGDRVRVSARLVRTSDGSIVWTGEFDRQKKDELQLQNEIAAQIVPVLALNLSSAEQAELAKKYTESADAYDLYLRGRHEWNKRSTPGMIEAQRLFRNAIAADPNFALAYVGLADTLGTNQPQQAESRIALAKALELDPNLAEAHASLGFRQMFYEWNWDAAEQSFRRSLELNPSYATAHHWYATVLAIRGETEAAKSQMRLALELNPVSPNFLADLGQLYYFSGEYGEAESFCLKALEIDPDFSFGHEYLHSIYLKTGDHEKAIAAISKADEVNGGLTMTSTARANKAKAGVEAYRSGGLRAFLEHRFPGQPTSPDQFYFYAMKHTLNGDDPQALDYLEKATDARMFLSAFVKAEPVFDRLRPTPRFKEILRKMKLEK